MGQKDEEKVCVPSMYLKITFACSSAVSYVSLAKTVHLIDSTSSISAFSAGSCTTVATFRSCPFTDDGRLSTALSIVRPAVKMATRRTYSPCSRARFKSVRHLTGSAENTRGVKKSTYRSTVLSLNTPVYITRERCPTFYNHSSTRWAHKGWEGGTSRT